MRLSKHNLIFSALVLFSIGWICNPASADDKHKGNGRGNSGHNQGFTGLSITPGGIGFTVQNQNFGFSVAPGTLRNVQQQFNGNPGFVNSNSYYGNPGVIVADPGFIADPGYDHPYLNNQPGFIPAGPDIIGFGPQPNSQMNAGGSLANQRSVVPTNIAASPYQIAAEIAFQSGDFESAMKAVRHSVVEDVRNGRIHLFASQVAFAMGDYETAANAALAGMDLLEPADWYFVVTNYQRLYRDNEYVNQMNRLNNYCKQFPNNSFAESIRAYQFFGLGHDQAATEMAQKAIKVNASDPLANRLLGSNQAEIEAPVPAPTTTSDSAPQSQSILQN